jgi:hypothetical protein
MRWTAKVDQTSKLVVFENRVLNASSSSFTGLEFQIYAALFFLLLDPQTSSLISFVT